MLAVLWLVLFNAGSAVVGVEAAVDERGPPTTYLGYINEGVIARRGTQPRPSQVRGLGLTIIKRTGLYNEGVIVRQGTQPRPSQVRGLGSTIIKRSAGIVGYDNYLHKVP